MLMRGYNGLGGLRLGGDQMIINIDDVADGALVNAITTLGRQLAKAVRKARRFRHEDDIAIAHWFDTYRLTSRSLDLSALPLDYPEGIVDVLRSDETQAALHDLLAVHLTRATAMEVKRAREAFSLTLTTAMPEAASLAATLADYYEDQIRELVARLESQESALLEQIRTEALPTR